MWRSSDHGGFTQPPKFRHVHSVYAKQTTPFVTVLFDESTFLDLVIDDPQCISFRALGSRIEALKRDLTDMRGCPPRAGDLPPW